MEKRITLQNHSVSVKASRQSADSRWTIEVDVVAPDGSALPTVRDDDNSYSTIEDAFAAGVAIGERLVD